MSAEVFRWQEIRERAVWALDLLQVDIKAKQELRAKTESIATFADEVARSGSWSKQGVRRTYTEDVIGSGRDWPHEYVGTNYVPLDELRAVAVRELQSESPSGNIKVGILIDEGTGASSQVIAMTSAKAGTVELAGVGEPDMQGLLAIEDLLIFVGSSDSLSDHT